MIDKKTKIQKYKETKRQKILRDKNTKIQKYKKTKRQKRQKKNTKKTKKTKRQGARRASMPSAGARTRGPVAPKVLV